jgi:hypothetical protein
MGIFWGGHWVRPGQNCIPLECGLIGASWLNHKERVVIHCNAMHYIFTSQCDLMLSILRMQGVPNNIPSSSRNLPAARTCNGQFVNCQALRPATGNVIATVAMVCDWPWFGVSAGNGWVKETCCDTLHPRLFPIFIWGKWRCRDKGMNTNTWTGSVSFQGV